MRFLCRIIKIPKHEFEYSISFKPKNLKINDYIYMYMLISKNESHLRHSGSCLIFLLVQAVKETICGEEEPEAGS